MCFCAWDSMRSALAESFWEKRQWRSQEHTELILLPVLRSHGDAASKKILHYKLHEPTSETWLKKKKLLSFLQARIGHTVHGLYAAQRMRNPPWIKVEQRLCQLLARAMHSQCPLSLGVALERGENLFCLQDGERWKQWDCMAFLFIPCQFLKIWKCLKVIPRHGRKEVVSQQLGEKTRGRIYVFIKESCCSTMASNVFPVLLTIKRLWIHLNREGTLGRMNGLPVSDVWLWLGRDSAFPYHSSAGKLWELTSGAAVAAPSCAWGLHLRVKLSKAWAPQSGRWEQRIGC